MLKAVNKVTLLNKQVMVNTHNRNWKLFSKFLENKQKQKNTCRFNTKVGEDIYFLQFRRIILQMSLFSPVMFKESVVLMQHRL